jgi:hypothetical protein
LIEYETLAEAETAINQQNGKPFLDNKPLVVGYAFSTGPVSAVSKKGAVKFAYVSVFLFFVLEVCYVLVKQMVI